MAAGGARWAFQKPETAGLPREWCPVATVCVVGRWGKRRDQVAARGKLQRNQPKAPSVHKKGLELHPVGSERQLMGLPFKDLQGHSEASETLSLEIQGN